MCQHSAVCPEMLTLLLFLSLFIYTVIFFSTAGVPSGSKVSQHRADPIKLHSCIFCEFPIETCSLYNNQSSSEKEVGAGHKGLSGVQAI